MMLAMSVPSHGMQAFLFIVALVLFLTAGIVAWFTPALNKAVAFGFWGLTVVAFVWAWIELALS